MWSADRLATTVATTALTTVSAVRLKLRSCGELVTYIWLLAASPADKVWPMKRSCRDLDRAFARLASQFCPDVAQMLEQLNDSEERLDGMFRKKKRVGIALYSDPRVIQKYLRVYVKHQFFPNSDEDRAHYVVTVSGRLLDHEYEDRYYFCSLFEEVRLVVDRKHGQTPLQCEWTLDNCPDGAAADCFRFKVYSDKAIMVKLYMRRAEDVQMRYEVSPSLRQLIIPGIRSDPSLQDVLLAMWHYITVCNLQKDRDKRIVTCDEVENFT